VIRTWLLATAAGTVLAGGVGLGALTSTLARWWPGPLAAQAPPTGAIDVANSGYPIERNACLAISVGQGAGTECGHLRVVHALPSVRVFDTDVTPTLLYNSEFAHPYVTVPVLVTQLATTTPPDSVDVELYTSPYNTTRTLKARAAWPGTEWPAGTTTTRRIAIAYDAIGDTTGVYGYHVKLGNWYGGTRVQQASTPGGGYYHVNRSASPYGAGWWLAGLEQLTPYYVSGGTTALLWVGGDGSARTFTIGQTMYYERRDSVLYDAGTATYIRHLPEGRRTVFDLTGRHTKTVNRFGRETRFLYVGGSPTLDSISLPAPTGLGYKFGYTSGKLTSVTAPRLSPSVPRVTSLVNTGGNVVSIRNAGDSLVAFAYLSPTAQQHLLQGRTSRRGTTTAFTYDSAFRVRTSSVTPGFGGATITTTVHAGETRGLPRSGTPSSVDTAKVYTKLDGPRSVADTTVLFQGRFGTVRRSVDARGAITRVRSTVSFDGWEFSWPTTRVQQPRGQVVLYEWDLRGNVVKVIDSTGTTAGVSDTTRYTYDGTFDQIAAIVQPEKDSLAIGISATNGRREWRQDARGTSSRVVFHYDNGSYPEEVTRVELPAVGGGATATYTYTYHATTRNAIAEQSPLGFVTTWTQDAIGRDSAITTPIDSNTASTARVVRRLTYSLRGEVTHEATATQNVSPAESLLVRSYFDPDGLVERVDRSMSPDPASIGTMTTRTRRDGIGRVIAVEAPDGRTDSTTYNELGKPLSLFSRRYNPSDAGSAQPVTTQYDVLGRDSVRTIPGLSYAARLQGIPTRHSAYGLDSAYRALSIPSQVLTFLYDIEGRDSVAWNAWARVTRLYTRNGRDSTERQELAEVASGTLSHNYLVSYIYDRNGRRRKLATPSQLVPANKDTIRFMYNVWGSDSLIRDSDNNTYRFTYTERGEPAKLEYLAGNLARHWHYDADGRLKADSTANGSLSFPRWTYSRLRDVKQWHDGRGKLLQRVSSIAMYDTLQARYTGLGSMRWSRHSSAGISQLWGTPNTAWTRSIDSMATDPLGNTVNGWTQDTVKYPSLPATATPLIPRPATYTASVGRMATMGASIPGVRSFTYDSAGNESFSSLVGDNGGNNPSEDRASYYNAAGQLIAAEYRSLASEINYNHGLRKSFEVYRYDPYGRRVLVRAMRHCQFVLASVPEPSGDSPECVSGFVRRTVWDGPRELAEIQMPDSAASRENDTGYHTALALLDTKDPNPFYGRVVYTYAQTIDQPLAIFRLGYADRPHGGSFTTSWGNFVVNPIWDATGEVRIGTFGNGAAVRQLVSGGSACAVGNSAQRCVKVYWPESFSPRDRLRGYTPVSYMGSLVEGKRNTTGTEYKRARVYDPQSGRFTQEDPIGLAGGLNLYGYADGDPVNFSDPFGLCPKDMGGDGKTKWLTDCPEGSEGRAEWNRRASGRAEAVDDPIFLFFGGLEKKGAEAAAGVGRKAIGGVITGFRKHGLNQAISREGVGVSTRAILDAVKHPVKTVAQSEGRTLFIGRDARVVVNHAGEVITVQPLGSRAFRIPR